MWRSLLAAHPAEPGSCRRGCARGTAAPSVAPLPPAVLGSMGAGFSYLYNRIFGGGEYKVVMVGLDNAGKSTILYRLCATYGLPSTRDSAPSPTAAHLLARAGTWAT